VLPQGQLTGLLALVGDFDRATGGVARANVARLEDRHAVAGVLEVEAARGGSRYRLGGPAIAAAAGNRCCRRGSEAEKSNDRESPHR
jgi:hypothetical protein